MRIYSKDNINTVGIEVVVTDDESKAEVRDLITDTLRSQLAESGRLLSPGANLSGEGRWLHCLRTNGGSSYDVMCRETPDGFSLSYHKTSSAILGGAYLASQRKTLARRLRDAA